MYLYTKLQNLKKPIRVAFVGCGKFVSMFLAQYKQLNKIILDSIIELDVERAKKNCLNSGLSSDTIQKINFADNLDKVFNREIGMNQGIQFPIAECYSQIEAASLMVDKAAMLFDEGKKCGAEANMAKMLAADASWKAGTTAMETFGGFGFSKEYDIERKFRDTRLYQTAPVSRNLILSYIAEHVLNLPRSF